MFKSYSLLTVLFAFVLLITPLQAEEKSVYDMIKPADIIYGFETKFGMPHTGTLIERLNKLEIEAFGQTYSDTPIKARCYQLQRVFFESEAHADIVPKLHNQMEKVVSKNTDCILDICYQKDIVQYYRDGNYMSINTLDKIDQYGNKFSKLALKDLDQFLSGKTGFHQLEIGTLFNTCIESVCAPLGEVPNVNYPGMNLTRALYIIDTEDQNFMGNIGIMVYASRGDQYVLLSKSTYLKTHDDMTGKPMPLYQSCLNELGIKDTLCNTGPFMECYQRKLKNNKEVQTILKQQTNALIDFFAL